MPGLNATKVPLTDEQGRYRTHTKNRVRLRTIDAPEGAVWDDFARGARDIGFFAERWLGIRGHPGQLAWWAACAERGENGWSPRYLTTVVSSGNRAGKTTAMAIVVLHHTLYKLGLRPPRPGDVPDAERWSRAPYQWYHVAPTQGQAELVHQEINRILAGSHMAQQGRGCPLTEAFPGIAVTDRKYRGEYLWIVISPLFGGGEIHFRTTQEKAKALLGIDMNGISFDEAAFELYLATIHDEVLNLRRLSTGGPLHYIGTPTEGTVEYRDLWLRGDPDNPERDPQVRSFRISTRDNIGYGVRQADFDAILRQQAPYLIPQNIDGFFIEAQSAYFTAASIEAAFDAEMEQEGPPLAGHRYSQAVDPGVAADASVALTLDYTKRPFVGVRMRRTAGHQTLPGIVNMVREGHLLYSQGGAMVTTTVDSTAMGGKMFVAEFSIIKPLRSFDFAGTKAKKLELLTDLKAAIEKGWLRFPKSGPWLILRRELLAYKLDDRRIEQDCVMALAMAVRHAIRNPTDGAPARDFAFF